MCASQHGRIPYQRMRIMQLSLARVCHGRKQGMRNLPTIVLYLLAIEKLTTGAIRPVKALACHHCPWSIPSIGPNWQLPVWNAVRRCVGSYLSERGELLSPLLSVHQDSTLLRLDGMPKRIRSWLPWLLRRSITDSHRDNLASFCHCRRKRGKELHSV
jgi:hypothetical protein